MSLQKYKQDIYTEINNNSTLSNLLVESSNDYDYNLFHNDIPEEANLSNGYLMSYNETSQGNVNYNLKIPTISFNCFGKNSENAIELANALEDLFHQKTNMNIGNNTFAYYAKKLDQNDLKDPDKDMPYINQRYKFKL